jgi:hypothetical protein
VRARIPPGEYVCAQDRLKTAAKRTKRMVHELVLAAVERAERGEV